MLRIRDVIIGVIPDISYYAKWENKFILEHVQEILCENIIQTKDLTKTQIGSVVGSGTHHIANYKHPDKFIIGTAVNDSLSTLRKYECDDLKAIFLFTNQYNDKKGFHYKKIFHSGIDDVKIYTFMIESKNLNLGQMAAKEGQCHYIGDKSDLEFLMKKCFEDFYGS